MTDPIQTQSDARKKADGAWERAVESAHNHHVTRAIRDLKHAVQAEITARLEASTKDPKSPLGHLYAMRDEDLQGQADMEERVARLEGREGDTGVAGAMAQLVRRAEHQATVIADLRKRFSDMTGWNVAEILKAAKDEPPVEEADNRRHRDYTVAAMSEREGNRLDHFERRLAVWHERLLAVEDHLRENGGFPPIGGEPKPAPHDSPGPEKGTCATCLRVRPAKGVCLYCGNGSPAPGPELPHEGPCDGFGPDDTCAQCHDAGGPELPEAVAWRFRLMGDEGWARGSWVYKHGMEDWCEPDPMLRQTERLYSEATVRSLIERAEKAERLHNEADRQRDEWFSKYAEAERRLGELERTNLTLIAEKEKAERERDTHLRLHNDADKQRDVWFDRWKEAQDKVDDLEAKLAQRPTITEEEIRAAKAAAGQSIWRPDVASALRTLADKLQRIRDRAPAHDCTEHVQIEVTRRAKVVAGSAVQLNYGDLSPGELHDLLTAAIPHLKLVPKEEDDAE